MIPLPQILAEFVMAFGGALLIASIYALVKPKRSPEGEQQPVQARGRVLVNAAIGFVVLAWGFASFITPRG